MQITIRTLGREEFKVDVPENSTVRDVKRRIHGIRGESYNEELLRLICSGKVLEDDQLVFSECNLQPSGFLVCMVSKPKPKVAAATLKQVIQPMSQAESTVGYAAASAGLNAGAITGNDTTSAIAASVTLVSQENVNQLCAMGFPDDEVRAALRAAFNNVEVAANYLMTGLPDFADTGFKAPGLENNGDGGVIGVFPSDLLPGIGEDTEMTIEDESLMNPLAHLRYHPQFMELREMVQNNPSSLPQIIQAIGEQSPDLLNMINANPQAFIQLLTQPIESGSQVGESGDVDEPSDDEDDEMETDVAAEESTNQMLSEQDNRSIAQLEAILPHVPRQQIIEAYLSCDKNMEYAMNLLFDS